MGLIGIVNGLATKDLPTKSRDLAFMIVENVRKNPADFNSSAKLKVLIKDIIAILNRDIFNDSNIKLFESRLSETFIASTGQKRNLVKILLYFLYNQGQQTHTWNFPELEHLEPSNPLVGASPYYSNQDRVEVINRFGNFALIEKSINIVDFSNKPLIEKLRLVKENPKLSKIALFQNDLFLNLDFDNCKTSSTIYGELPLISKAQSPTLSDTDSFTFEGEPTKYFFDIRSKTLASLSKNIICNTQNFLDGSGTYL
jgi:hypothetical protein